MYGEYLKDVGQARKIVIFYAEMITFSANFNTFYKCFGANWVQENILYGGGGAIAPMPLWCHHFIYILIYNYGLKPTKSWIDIDINH